MLRKWMFSKMPGEPKVSVVIPTWKRGDLLQKCLESLRRQSYTDFETVLVSNGAGEWVEQVAREFQCRLIRFGENRGFAAGVNAGIAASQSPYVAVLNDDVELDCAWLERTTVLLDERADLSFCCGKIYRADGRTIDNAGDALSMGGGAWRLGFGRADAPEFDLPRPLRAISMTASLFRRKAFEKLGGLDEDFISYLEDIDLSIRAWRAGFRGIYLPRAVARHQGSATAGGPESPLVFEHLTRNQLLLMVKHYPLVLWLRLALRIGWAQLLWAGMAIRKGLLGAYLRGGMGFYLLLPRMIRKRVPWRRGETKEFLAWLRESEEAIYADISSRPRSEQDTYWRMYFLLFPPRARAAVASKPGLGRLPSR